MLIWLLLQNLPLFFPYINESQQEVFCVNIPEFLAVLLIHLKLQLYLTIFLYFLKQNYEESLPFDEQNYEESLPFDERPAQSKIGMS